MKIVSKFILRELIAPFWFGMGIITFAFILNVMFRDLPRFLGKGIPVLVILEVFFYNLAWIIALAVPMSILISVLMTFGQMSSDNEIVALKSSGVHVYRLIAPVLVIAVIFTFLMERFNNVVLPEFNLRAKRLYGDISQKKPTASLEPNVFFNDIPNYSILVRDVDARKNLLKDVLIHDSSDPKYTKTIIAKEGTLEYIESEGRLSLTLFDGEIHEVNQTDLEEYHRLEFNKQVVSIPADNMSLKRSEHEVRGDREKGASLLWEDVRKNQSFIKDQQKKIQNRAIRELKMVFPHSFFSSGEEKEHSNIPNISLHKKREAQFQIKAALQQIRGDRSSIQRYLKNINKYKVEIYKKYSIPFACIVFVLIGVPLGIMSRQGGIAMAGGMSLIFYIIYWSCLIGGEQLADRMMLNPWLAMWLPNIVVGIIGIYLVIHSVREATFIHWEYILDWFRKIFKKRSA